MWCALAGSRCTSTKTAKRADSRSSSSRWRSATSHPPAAMASWTPFIAATSCTAEQAIKEFGADKVSKKIRDAAAKKAG